MSFETFGFLAVMYGVILSLGIAALLAAMGAMLRSFSSGRPYWVYASWVGLQLVLYLHVWWNLWGLQQAVADWNFFLFIMLLLGPAALFLSTQVLLFEPSSGTDTREHYFTVHRIFFALVATVVAWELAAGPLFFGAPAPEMALQIAVLIVLVALIVSKRPALHGWLAIASWVLFVVGVVSDGLHLGA